MSALVLAAVICVVIVCIVMLTDPPDMGPPRF